MFNWINRLPPYDCQVSVNPVTDALDCLAESFCNIWFMITGVRVSPRALAVMARLDIPANRTVSHLLSVINARGLVLYENCPTPIDFSFDAYYTPLTSQESITFPVSVNLIPFDLNASPGWTEIQWGINSPGVYATDHMTAQITDTQYFDSELGNPVKPLNYEGATIQYQTSIKITKGARMLVFFQVKGNPTWWILGDGEWVGFSDMTALTSYVHGRPYTLSPIQLDQVEFNKIPANPDVFKS